MSITLSSSTRGHRKMVSIFDSRSIVNPGTLLRLSRFDSSTPEWKNEVGKVFMVGFYSQKDGFDCVWLVNSKGQYEQTADWNTLLQYFTVAKPSPLDDYYGKHSKLPRWPVSLKS